MSREYIIPVAPNRWVRISAEWPVTPAEWERMLLILEVFKPGLVRADGEEAET